MSLKLRKRIVKKTIFNQNEIINETPKIENSILDKKKFFENKTPTPTELNKLKKQSPKKEISKEELLKERMKKMRDAKLNKKNSDTKVNDVKTKDVKITKTKKSDTKEPIAEISIDDLFSKKNNNKTIKQTKSKITEIDLSSDED